LDITSQLLSGGNDLQVIIWDVNLADWRSLACDLANRTLSEDEGLRYLGNSVITQTCG
jgi:hypothetical protein